MKKLAGIEAAGRRCARPRARRAGADHRADADAEAGAALRRPQAARRDRPCLHRRPEARRLRRADLGARRLGPGGDPQPARRAAGRAEGLVPLHLARSRRRPLHLRPDRRALPRPPDGARAGRRRLRRPAPSVHRGAALGRADGRRWRPRPDQARGRHPERGRPTVGLRLPQSLPAQDRRHLRRHRAAARRGGVEPPHAVPHPDRRAARPATARRRFGLGRTTETRGLWREDARGGARGRRRDRDDRDAGARRAEGAARCSCASERAVSVVRTTTLSTAPRRPNGRSCSGTRAPEWSRRSGPV